MVLNSDTSLVRVILTSDSVEQLMIYEAYPYIVSDWDNYIVRQCDETMYLDTLMPNSIRIQLVNATFVLDTIHIKEEMPANPKTLQEQHKALVENAKVNAIQNIIQLNYMLWFAERNPISDLSHSDKTGLFGEKFNMCGMDYYVGGVYDPIPGVDSPPDESQLVDNFDWRSRHGANDSEKVGYYYDAEEPGTGWLSSVKNQNTYQCNGLCYIYGPLGALEGLINIYFNRHCYYDLSEQQVLDCDSNNTNEQCEGGNPGMTSEYIRINGVVDETCYPREHNPGLCRDQTCPSGYQTQYKVFFASFQSLPEPEDYTDPEEIKRKLINQGPLYATLNAYVQGKDHVMSIIGYEVINEGDVFYILSNYGNDSVIVENDSPYIGQLYWIYKDSRGTNIGINGFIPVSQDSYLPHHVTYFEAPIYVEFDDIYNDPRDADNDGYWNWGLFDEPELPGDACSQDLSLEDSDDSENRIGPFNENYFGIPVKPEISVEISLGGLNPTMVEHGDFYFFDMDNCTLTVKISNPGTAQLNLDAFAPVVTIDQEYDPECFVLTGNQPDPKICMNGGYSTFTINFDASDPDLSHIAEVSIHLAECDMDPVFEFALVYNGCGYSTEDHEIRTNTQLAGYHAFQQDIKVCSGYTLEVTGKVAMTENASIFVDQGAQLIINGGAITGSCDKLWKGIDVWGNPYLYQSPANQGLVKIFNGGTVEFADTAIETGKYELPHDFTPSGGIIYCQDAVFKDNIIDVCFHPYQGIYSGLPQPNLSKFERSLFETTDDLSFLEYSPPPLPDKHVILNQVNGIHFRGSHFVNYTDAVDTRGIGIYSYEAGYFVEGKCNVPANPCPDLTHSVFEALNYGIRAFNNTGVYTVSVHDAEFLHNHRGIFMSLVEHPTVIRSNFDLSDPGSFWITDPSIVGLYMENFTTGFQVEDNQFFGELGQTTTVGIHILNTGPVFNEIYNNDLKYLQTGITAAGENRDGSPAGTDGLCIKCNDFTDCMNDINITPEGGIVQANFGIAIEQGEPSTNGEYNLAAGNIFSDFDGLVYNYDNDETLNQIHYIHHNRYSTQKKVRPTEFVNINRDEDLDADYLQELSCPSNLGGGGINTEIERLSVMNEGNIISLQEDTLNAMIDGGNTWAMDLNIQTSLPEEALPLRQSLIDESPFLSDTILKSAIAKEDVLVNAMIRDILISNPQAAKTPSVIERLFERNDTMPDYMLEEIMNGLEVYGEKEIRLRNLAPHRSRQFRALNKLNRYFKQDSSGINSADSILQIFQNYTSLSAEYQKAFIYMSGHDSFMAGSILDQIPPNYDLSESELETYDSYHELFDIISDIDLIYAIDSINLLRLLELSNETHIPGIYARNMLVSDGSLLYQEPVFIGSESYKRSEISTGNNNSQIEKNNYLNIFPNPSKTFLTIEYDLKNLTGNSILNISDLSGRSIDKLSLNKRRDQFVYNNSLLRPGLYLVELTVNEELIESVKFVVIK